MLATAGFHSVTVTAALEDRAPKPWKDERVILRSLESVSHEDCKDND